MKKLLLTALLFSSIAAAQSCPGGFWGNGQCIAPCESPLINPNVNLSFYGYQCQRAQLPCEDGYLYCYPEYLAYDNAYQSYCGVIIDWNDGACYAQPPQLNLFPPKRRDNLPDFSPAFLKLTIGMRRPVEFKITPIKKVVLHKNRFWWRHI